MLVPMPFVLLVATAFGPQQVEPLAAPTPAGGVYPALASAPDGSVHALWTRREGSEAVLQHARFDGAGWSPADEVARGADWFVNWADFPQLCVAADGTLLATWLKRSGEGSYDYRVEYALRAAEGGEWSAPARLHSHDGGGEHGFVSLAAEEAGFRAVWLDGRGTAAAPRGGDGHGSGDGHAGGPMALYTAHVSVDGTVSDEHVLDTRVCDCCATAVAALPDGGWAAAYRDRSAEEVRDIGFVGEAAQPSLVHADSWRIEGCPVNGPVMARSGAQLAVAWFTMGDDARPRCRIAARHADGSFGMPTAVDLGAPHGRLALCALPGDGFLVAWMEAGEEGDARWMMRGWHPERGLGEPRQIATAPGARASGFLRMAACGDDVVAAWTDARAQTIVCARIRLQDDQAAKD